MTATATDNTTFIARYLQALSGKAKTPAIVAELVTDPSLIAHIRDVEAEYELEAEEVVAERDLVAMRGTFRGVHRGPFAGIEATGRTVSAPLMIFYRIADGRIAQHWLQFDGAGLVAQLQQDKALRAE